MDTGIKSLVLMVTVLGAFCMSNVKAQIATIIIDSRSMSIDSFSNLIQDNPPMKAFRIHGGGWAVLPEKMSVQNLDYLTVIDIPYIYSSVCQNENMIGFNMSRGSFMDLKNNGICRNVSHVSFDSVKWESAYAISHLFPNVEVVEVYAQNCFELSSFVESSGLSRFDEDSVGDVVLLVNSECVSDYLDLGFRRVEGH
jgi:hypothetical protein